MQPVSLVASTFAFIPLSCGALLLWRSARCATNGSPVVPSGRRPRRPGRPMAGFPAHALRPPAASSSLSAAAHFLPEWHPAEQIPTFLPENSPDFTGCSHSPSLGIGNCISCGHKVQTEQGERYDGRILRQRTSTPLQSSNRLLAPPQRQRLVQAITGRNSRSSNRLRHFIKTPFSWT